MRVISGNDASRMECPLNPGGFNRSAQHLLILRGEEVCHGDVEFLVRGSAEGRAVGAMEERAKCCCHLAGAGKQNKTGVERIVVLLGGIVPAPRRRALAALERRGTRRDFPWHCGGPVDPTDRPGGLAPSIVSREIRRNGGSQAYSANRADRRAWERALRPKPCRLAPYREHDGAWRRSSRWSPQQISGWLKQEFPRPTETCRYLTKRSRGPSSSRPAAC